MPGAFFAGNLRTGEILVRNIPAIDGKATAILGAAGSITCKVQLPMVDPYTEQAIAFTNLITGPKSFLGYEEWVEDDEGAVLARRIINAGPVWNDTYEWDDGTFEMNAAGIRSIFNWRLVLQLLDDLDPDDLPGALMLHYDGDLRQIAKELVATAVQQTAGELPIDLPADTTGTNERNWIANEYNVVGQMLENLSGVINGPDVAFRPYFDDPTHVRWQMLTGDPELTQAGDDHKWIVAGPSPAIRGTSIKRDWSTLRTAAYGVGRTETSDLIESKSIDDSLTDIGFPRMEVGVTEDVQGEDVLQGKLDGVVHAGKTVQQSMSFEASKLVPPYVTSYNEGDYAKVNLPENPVTATGDHRVRIMSIDVGYDDDFAKITCAPERVPA